MHDDIIQKNLQLAIKAQIEKVFSKENHESNLIVLPISAYVLKGIDYKSIQE